MPVTERDDQLHMARALELAARGRGLTSPNPMVGAVVVRDGQVVGEGFHRRAGSEHAEIEALARAGAQARGATLYVALEPCVHQGRTPPCAPVLLESGLSRVVVAVLDPNPKVNGRGVQALREAGVSVTVGVLGEEARALNRVFFTYMLRARPFVTMKAAMTLDGKIAAWDRSSRWISGEESRQVAHRMRAEADAIVVGIGTVLEDDPELTVRTGRDWPKEPYRIIVDSHLRLPLDARLFSAGTRSRILVATTDLASQDRVDALQGREVPVLACPARDGRVDLVALTKRLAEMDITTLLLEGGSSLNAAFLEASLVDRVVFFVAPKIVGGARALGPVGGDGRSLKEAFRVANLSVRSVGDDLLVEGDIEYE